VVQSPRRSWPLGILILNRWAAGSPFLETSCCHAVVSERTTVQGKVPVTSRKLAEITPDFVETNKRFYLDEDNDLTGFADRFVGPETLFHRGREKAMRKLARALKLGGPWLDVGCGSGLNLRHLPAGSVGLDLNPRNLQKAGKRAPQAVLTQADMYRLPFRDETFGAAVCSEVLEHVPDPQIALAEIWRTLRKGGMLIGTVPTESLIWRLRFLSRHRGHEPYHKHYTRADFMELISSLRVRFRVERCVYAIPLSSRSLSMSLVFVLQRID
jgi:SAM-dependent methyltransferase